MLESLKRYSPAVFGIGIICFTLPWVNLTCADQHVATFTGLQLVTGTTIQERGSFGQNLKEKRRQELQNKVMNGEMTQEQADRIAKEPPKVAPEPLAVAILLLAILGLALSFLKSPKSSFMPGLVGAVALILLLLLKSKIETDATSQGQGMMHVEYAIGFWLVLISFIVAIALNGYFYVRPEKQVRTLQPQS